MSLTPPLGCKETPHKGDQCTNLTSLPLLSSTLTSTTPSKRVSKIYYTSRTHKQLTQVIKELKNNTVYRPRMTVLGSRNQYCIHEPVMKSSNRDEACQKQVKEHTCPYYLNVRSLRFCKSLPKVWDIEDLKQMGSTTFGCPYFAARQLVEDALLIFCPYNYLIDPIIRNALEIDLTDCIIIIDEGHNIEDCARDAATCEVTDHELGALYQEFLSLEAYTKNETTDLEDFNAFLSKRDLETDQLRSFLRSLIDFLQNNLFDFQTKDFEKQFKIVPTVELVRFLGLAGFTQEKISLLTKEFKELSDVVQSDHRNQIGNEQPLISQKLLNPLHKILLLLEYLLDPNFTNDFHVVVTKKVSKKLKAMDWDSKLSFLCMNPSIAFSAFKNATSVILTSGTLSPMNSFASELNTRFEITLEADHVLNPGQAWVGVFPQWQGLKLTGTYKSSETFAYQDQIGLALLSILQKVPNGVLMFVPSYSFVEKLVNRWTITGCLEKLQSYKAIFYEHKVQTSFEPLLAEYYDIVDRSVKNEGNGALLIAVYRGKVSEGIDFSDHRARAVICVGIPYPLAFDIQVNLKRDYNDANQHRCQLLSGSDWYNIQGFRALNQALGRCLRHKNDWGALILLEERLQSEWYQKGLSKWVRQRLVVFDNEENGMQSLNNFIQSRIAPCMT
ncbi:Fanconi anemia group J protein [Coelomomyces lativittatus]|nr:Fanconi anemia group J protein [Coelomomyces lativittatus]